MSSREEELNFRVTADTKQAATNVGDLKADVAELEDKPHDVEVDADVTRVLDAFDEVGAEAKRVKSAADALGQALGRLEPLVQTDAIRCVSIAWTELLRVVGRVDLTSDEALTYAAELHTEAAVLSLALPGGEPDVATVGEALRRRGVIAGLRLIRTADDVLAALDHAPVVACLPWRHGLVHPRSGVVASIAGAGEEYLDTGRESLHCHVLVQRHDRLDRRGVSRTTDVVELRASIGRSWGVNGTAFVRVGDLSTLLAYVRSLPGFGYLAAGPVWPQEV